MRDQPRPSPPTWALGEGVRGPGAAQGPGSAGLCRLRCGAGLRKGGSRQSSAPLLPLKLECEGSAVLSVLARGGAGDWLQHCSWLGGVLLWA